MMKSACWRLPMTMTAGTRTSGLGQQASAMPRAAASTATSSSTIRDARQAERRVRRCTSSFGRARRKSSLNSSPFIRLLVDPARQHVLDLEVFLDAVLGALAAESRLLHAAERRHLGGDDARVHADDAGLHALGDAEHAADVAALE